MADERRLSVIVPAHNAGPFIADTLKAIIANDLPRDEWELIVVDDASTDDTARIAAELADTVIATGTMPRGPGTARNRGAAVAAGEIIAFIDADVIANPDTLSRMVERLDEDPSRVAVFGAYDDAPRDQSRPSVYRNLLHHYTHLRTAGRVATFWAGCGAVKRDAFLSVGGFDEKKFPRPQIEDIELGYRLNRIGSILLDPSIQGKHLKRWSVKSMMVTDFRDRAVPWVRLLLSAKRENASSNPSLGAKALASTMLAGLSVLLLLIALLSRQPYIAAVGVLCAAIFVALNTGFYSFLRGRGGWPLALTAIPLHFGYQLISAVAVPVGAVQFALDRGRDDPSAAQLTGRRFMPLASGEIGARFIAFFATAYLARKLGATAFGEIAFAMALVNHFGNALSVGIGEVGSREVARDPEHAPAHAATGAALRLLLAGLAIIAVLVIAQLLGLDAERRKITWLYALGVIPLALDTGWVYKGLGRTGRVGKSFVLDQVVSLALILMVVHNAAHVIRVPIIQLIGDFVAALFLGIPLLRGEWTRPTAARIKSLANKSRLITGSRMLRTIVLYFDIVLLGILVTSREVGWYSAAYRIVFFVMAILYASHAAFLPEIARSVDAPGNLGRILSRSVGFALAVTIPFIVGGWLLAAPLMTLVFGGDYQAGAVALQILLVSLFFLAIHAATRNVFLTLDRLGLEAWLVAAGVVVNVALNIMLIPRQGIQGAAIATLAGEIVIMVGAVGALVSLGVRISVRDSLPAIFSGFVLALVIRVVSPQLPLLLTVALGAAAYTVVILATTAMLRRTRELELASAG
jgi:O-antigen/teichoic acid export membrane protein